MTNKELHEISDRVVKHFWPDWWPDWCEPTPTPNLLAPKNFALALHKFLKRKRYEVKFAEDWCYITETTTGRWCYGIGPDPGEAFLLALDALRLND